MKRALLFAAMCCLLLSCTKQEIPVDERIPINISVDQLTKVNDQSYEDCDKIGVFVVNYNNSTPGDLDVSGNHVNNIGFTYSEADNSWNPDETIYWKDKKTSADFYVYYPYNPELGSTDEYIFSVDSDQGKNGLGASDFLWGKSSNVTPTSSAVPIVTNHVLSRIALKIKSIDGSDENLDEIIQSVKISGVQTSAKIDLSTGKAIPYGEAKEITPFRDENGTYKAMVIPQEVEADSKLVTITIDNVNYVYKNDITFKENTQHNFEIAVSKTGMSVNVTIGPWEDVTADDNGVAEEDNGVIDLSANGTSNCYLIQQAGEYKFKTVQGNSSTSVGTAATAEVLWESFGTSTTPQVGELIASTSYTDGYVTFSTPESMKNGNAVIAVKDAQGTVLWSWHIWCSSEGFIEQTYSNNAGIMMDRNLGATGATAQDGTKAYGLLYQWGRKDPFLPGTASSKEWPTPNTSENGADATIEYAIQNPMTFMYYKNLHDWYYPGNNSYSDQTRWSDNSKTIYDPCPTGWRVPTAKFWSDAGFPEDGYPWNELDLTNGFYIPLELCSTQAWFPAVGYLGLFQNNHKLNETTYGYYWTTTYGNYYNFLCMYFNTDANNISFADWDGWFEAEKGKSIRCIKE